MKRLLILLMLVSQPAWAGWVELGSAGSGTDLAFTHYFDPATVRKTANGRRAWSINSYDQRQTTSNGTTFQSDTVLFEVDCGGERLRTLQTSTHSGPMGKGQTVLVENSPGDWRVASPGSVGEAQLKAICRMPLK